VEVLENGTDPLDASDDLPAEDTGVASSGDTGFEVLDDTGAGADSGIEDDAFDTGLSDSELDAEGKIWGEVELSGKSCGCATTEPGGLGLLGGALALAVTARRRRRDG